MLREMERLIRAYEMIPKGCRVLCALSGGADSVCLLGALYRLREKLDFELAAAHYDHGLRGAESDRDVCFVRELVSDRFPGVPLYEGRGDVSARARETRMGVEETARELRYAFLEGTARENAFDRIATAHTADDNAETVLLHLARGSGLRGLTGIPPVRGKLIRPLLTATRREVEEFLEEMGLPHVEDSTNADDTFARNRVRHRVVPVLEELYPGFASRLADNVCTLARDEAYLAAQGKLLADRAEENRGLTISADLLASAPRPVGMRAARQLLARLRGGEDTCSAAHLEQILALCAAQAPSGETELPGNVVARREYGLLRLCFREERPKPLPGMVGLPGTTRFGAWNLTCVPEVYAGQEGGPREFWLVRAHEIGVRTRETGDTLKPPGRPTKSLKKWLVDQKIPRREREDLPVLTVNGRCAAVAELGVDINYRPKPGEEAWHILLTPVLPEGT